MKKYKEYKGDPLISEAADDIGTNQGNLLRGLCKAEAPVYKINGAWRVDRNWYENCGNIWNFVE